jgi:hypothetical protein
MVVTLKKKGKNPQVEDYRNQDAKRKNIPSAGLALRGHAPEIAEQIRWGLENPHPFSQMKTELIWNRQIKQRGDVD